MKIRITIESNYELELDELSDDVRYYISEKYEAAVLPPEYQDEAEYDGGSITYEVVED